MVTGEYLYLSAFSIQDLQADNRRFIEEYFTILYGGRLSVTAASLSIHCLPPPRLHQTNSAHLSLRVIVIIFGCCVSSPANRTECIFQSKRDF